MKDLTRCVVTPKVDTEGFVALGAGVYRASTIVFENAEAYANRGKRGPDGYSYGLYGTPTTRTLEAKLTVLEQGVRTFLLPSGQAANAIAMLPFLRAGDGVLLADSVYPPVRDFANTDLARFGVEVGYYDPADPSDLEARLNDRTKIVWCESPGSTTMEVQDLPRIADIAHRYGALLGCDNTWATPLNYKPLSLGADIVTEGLTKYISGHSDVLLGSLTVRDEQLTAPIRSTLGRLGICVSPDDASLVLRGTRNTWRPHETCQRRRIAVDLPDSGSRYRGPRSSPCSAHEPRTLDLETRFPRLVRCVRHCFQGRSFAPCRALTRRAQDVRDRGVLGRNTQSDRADAREGLPVGDTMGRR